MRNRRRRKRPSRLDTPPPALGLALALAVSGAACNSRPLISPVPVSTAYTVLARRPHDPSAFTQGLVYHNGRLYESTGHYGASTLREIDPESGAVLRQRRLPRQFFGEGLALWSNRLFQLTWREGVLFVYDLESFEPIGAYEWRGEGWGLAVWNGRLVASDGSAVLRFYDPDTLSLLGTVMVFEGDLPVYGINELESVRGELLANVYGKDYVIRIDPLSGRVIGRVDFRALVPPESLRQPEAVMNGLAYDEENDRLFLTGKNWPVLYELRLHF